MAEFLTMEDAENKFGTKGRTNAGLQYVDCKGAPKVITNVTSTIIDTPATSATPETLTPEIFKVVDVLIPRGKTIVTQDLINDLPTTTPQLAHCAYSVFVIQMAAPAPAPAQ